MTLQWVDNGSKQRKINNLENNDIVKIILKVYYKVSWKILGLSRMVKVISHISDIIIEYLIHKPL